MKTEIKELLEQAFSNFKMLSQSNFPKFKKIDDWLYKESELFKIEAKAKKQCFPNFKRGQIIKVDFGINLDSELSNTHFAIVLNSDDTTSNDNITVLPITSKNGYKRIKLNKILKQAMPNNKKYNLLCFGYITQITTISKSRIFKTNIKYICNDDTLNKIDNAIISYLT